MSVKDDAGSALFTRACLSLLRRLKTKTLPGLAEKMRDDSFAFQSLIVKVVHMPLVCLFKRHELWRRYYYICIFVKLCHCLTEIGWYSIGPCSLFFSFLTARISFVSVWASVYLLSENVSQQRVQWKDIELISLKCASCADLRFLLGKQRIISVYVSCFWLLPVVFFLHPLIGRLLHPEIHSLL